MKEGNNLVNDMKYRAVPSVGHLANLRDCVQTFAKRLVLVDEKEYVTHRAIFDITPRVKPKFGL